MYKLSYELRQIKLKMIDRTSNIMKVWKRKAALTLKCSVHTHFFISLTFVRNHPEIHWWEEEQKLSKLWGMGVRYNIRSCQKQNQWSEKSSGFMGRHCAQIARRIIIYLLFTAVLCCFLELFFIFFSLPCVAVNMDRNVKADACTVSVAQQVI